MTEVLDRLFAAENDRDWRTLETLLHPQIEWTLVGPITTIIRGREAYLKRLKEAYDNTPDAHFELQRSQSNGAGLVVTELLDNRGDVSVDVFDVRDGQVVREWEFLLGDSGR
ncbi:MAG: nuclear transport factor 2 family protein [Ornithinimicrobium sp.]